MAKILVTGGAGFIGSAVVRHLLVDSDHDVCNVDKLTYAGNLESIPESYLRSGYEFCQADIGDMNTMTGIINRFQPDVVMHLAAESHVDRSIDGPGEFIQTNVVGTYALLEVSRNYWQTLPPDRAAAFRFHHISTDEVYGDLLHPDETQHRPLPLFTETTPYAPSSPYSASKAASDHLVRAWQRTYGLPIVVTNCSNNYGPFHFPEKLIPHMILNALEGKPLPVYGDGSQIRDWLYVEDHARALVLVATQGVVGETYNIGGHNEQRNLYVVETLCDLLDELAPEHRQSKNTYRELIEFVADRPGHDRRYAINAGKIEQELGWLPQETFESGLRKTVSWYLTHRSWWQRVLSGDYQLDRIGTSK